MAVDCEHIPIVNYGEFSKRIHQKVVESKIPIGGSIEITSRCNLSCAHCYINLPANDSKEKEKELSLKEICKIFDELEEEGCLWLLLTGGEPLLRKDFLQLYSYAKRKGFLLTIFTNGTLITKKLAEYLSDWPPFSVEITVYGRTKETYEKVTGVPGSYEKCVKGIELLIERKIPLKLKSVIMSLNVSELLDIKKWVEEDLGLSFRFDPLLNARLDGINKPHYVRIPAQDIVNLDLDDEKRMKEWKEFCEKFLGQPLKKDKLFLCGAGINSFHIDSYGNLTPCILVRSKTFSLRNGSFKDGYYKLFPEILSQKPSKDTKCRTCELVAMCGQCPGWAGLEHGDMETPVEYLCEIAHLRAKKFKECWGGVTETFKDTKETISLSNNPDEKKS